MKIHIVDAGGVVHVSTNYACRDDWKIDQVTGTASTFDAAAWAAVRCISQLLDQSPSILVEYDHSGFVAGRLRDCFYCMAVAAHFASTHPSLTETPNIEFAVEIASRSPILQDWMNGSLADVLIGVVMERSIRVPATSIEADEWQPLIARLLQAAEALDLQSRSLASCGKGRAQ